MINSTHIKATARPPVVKGGAEAGYWPLARRAKHEIHALADAKGRLIAVLLTGGQATIAARRALDPKSEAIEVHARRRGYDSAELREQLDERGTKPVIPNRCNRKQPFTFNKRLYKLRWRIEAAFNRLKDSGASQYCRERDRGRFDII